MRDGARLLGVEQDREISPASAPAFWREYQRSILLALKEAGFLDEGQYQHAAERLGRGGRV